MVKGLYSYVRQSWKKPDKATLRTRMIEWRKSESIVKVDKPLRIDRARALGYKAKKGIIVVRVRLNRGGHRRHRPSKKRMTKKQTPKLVLKVNYKWIAEQRAQKKHKNLEVLNSYNIGKDGKHYFYEVILVDKDKPEIKSDRTLKWISKPEHTKRVNRGLTSAAKKSRGLRTKSRNMKVRPSLRSWGRKGK